MENQDIKIKYITSYELLRSDSSGIYIFGVGVDAESLYLKIHEKVKILGFVDNYRQGTIFHGIKVQSKEQFYNQYDHEMVVVASYRFAHEIIKNLDLDKIVDCRIWDDAYVFHMNEDIKRYIEFNKKIWNPHTKDTSRIVLCPIDNIHDGMSIIYSYFGNYVANENNAKLVGYCRVGMRRDNLSPIIRSVYESFGIVDVIDSELDAIREEEAQNLYISIVKDIKTWEDWKNIRIYNIPFGTSIIRYMNRFRIPELSPTEKENMEILYDCIKTIVFWYHFFCENDVITVFLKDGVSWESFICNISVSMRIPTYALQGEVYYKKLFVDFCCEPQYPYFRKFWEELSNEEKEYGMSWAKKHLESRLAGSTEDISYMDGNSTFSVHMDSQKYISDSDKVKLLICPHVFGEDEYVCGEQLFDNNYISWLCHLGELSNKLTKYEWYIKMHPNSECRDEMIISKYLEKYKNITRIPAMVSPWQLKEQGIKYVFTVYGTVGHEYSAMGINVINAGVNPHIQFAFSKTPKTKEEFDELVNNLDKDGWNVELEEIYKFYAINYLFYDWDYNQFSKEIYNDPLMYMDSYHLQRLGKERGTWRYSGFMNAWNKSWHIDTYNKIETMLKKMDEWDPKIFYKKDLRMRDCNE